VSKQDRHAAKLLKAAAQASNAAYAPYSGYLVGAAIEAEDGTIYSGCNLENASYGLTMCAERSAIAQAIAAGRRRFTQVAIVASGPAMPFPCGACRQVLAEFCGPETLIYVARAGELENDKQTTLGELFPHGFKL
jgi:homotetrameric cytidine deaminase